MSGLKVPPDLNCLHPSQSTEATLCQPALRKSLKLTSQNNSALLSEPAETLHRWLGSPCKWQNWSEGSVHTWLNNVCTSYKEKALWCSSQGIWWESHRSQLFLSAVYLSITRGSAAAITGKYKRSLLAGSGWITLGIFIKAFDIWTSGSRLLSVLPIWVMGSNIVPTA